MPTQARDSGTVVLPLIAWPRFGGVGGEASFKVSPVSFSKVSHVSSKPERIGERGETATRTRVPTKSSLCASVTAWTGWTRWTAISKGLYEKPFSMLPWNYRPSRPTRPRLSCGEAVWGATIRGGDCHCNCDPYPPEAGGRALLTDRRERLCSILTVRRQPYRR